MDLEVVGRHALLFDDDANAAFINSPEALVEWNSLSIDRYDVRHLLQSPPPPRKRRRVIPARSSASPPRTDSSLESELDHERYLDLPPPSDENEKGNGGEPSDAVGFHAVGFSYGKPDESNDQKNSEADSGFRPPFAVPESLLQNLPPTEKVHQIIARTAMFVSKHGGQSEIVLRVKQGNNPTFGFLMPDHHLHAYFRFLVDHQELVNDIDGKSLEVKKADSILDQTSGALSLLGSLYGGGDDEDGATVDAPEPKRIKSEEGLVAFNKALFEESKETESSLNMAGKDEVASKKLVPSLKEKGPIIKKNRPISAVEAKKGDAIGSLISTKAKSQPSSLPSVSKVEQPILEPPSELKRVVDKIVEFIQRNGKEFEEVLAEQDRSHGRFPFLLPSNQYHSYYLNVLQNVQESKLPSKGINSEKHDLVGRSTDKKITLSKEGKTSSSASAGNDIPYDYDRKEKFKMVIGKSKKDVPDQPSKPTQPPPVGISVDSAAAILQAATRGIKNPILQIFSKTSSVGQGSGPSSEVGDAVSVPVAKAIAETAASIAASEADSSEACLNREQKVKAERLKRAKMFAAMIKGGAATVKSEPSRGLSVEPPGSGVSGSAAEIVNLADKEREGSSVPYGDSEDEKFEKKKSVDELNELNERRSRRRYRSRTERHDNDVEETEDAEEEKEDKKDPKHSRKKHRSHRSSRHKHRKRHSSSKDRYSRHRHKHDSSSDSEHKYSRHRHKHSNNSQDDKLRRSRNLHNHESSSDEEHRNPRYHYRSDEYSDDDHPYHNNPSKSRRSLSAGEAELEEGEINMKSHSFKASGVVSASREPSVDLSKSSQGGRAPSEPSEAPEASDDLRAKIRAMLMATL